MTKSPDADSDTWAEPPVITVAPPVALTVGPAVAPGAVARSPGPLHASRPASGSAAATLLEAGFSAHIARPDRRADV